MGYEGGRMLTVCLEKQLSHRFEKHLCHIDEILKKSKFFNLHYKDRKKDLFEYDLTFKLSWDGMCYHYKELS